MVFQELKLPGWCSFTLFY